MADLNDTTNLEHLNIRVRLRSGQEATRLLCTFMQEHPKGVVCDYKYPKFRDWLLKAMNIPPEDALRVSRANLPPIQDDQSFWLTLICIERDTVRLRTDRRWKVPLLTLEWANDPTLRNQLDGAPPASEAKDPPTEENFDAEDGSKGRSRPDGYASGLEVSAIGAGTPSGEKGTNDNPLKLTFSGDDTRKSPDATETPTGNNDNTSKEEEAYEDPDELEEAAGNDSSMDDHAVLTSVTGAFQEMPRTTWVEICKFWNCSTDIKELKLPYLRYPMRHYQLAAAWFILTQLSRSRIPGAMLGDEPGLGKTAISICVLVTFRVLRATWDEVRQEWANPPAISQRRHMNKNQGGAAKGTCQVQSTLGVQCPCDQSGQAHMITQLLEDFPSIIICNPEQIGHWRDELRKFINVSTGSRARDMKVTVFHRDWIGDPESYHDTGAVRATKATPDKYTVIRRRDLACTLHPPPHGSRNIIITSSHLGQSLLKLYNDTNLYWNGTVTPTNRRMKGKRFSQRMIAASWVMLDECQFYHGGRTDLTIPFATLRDLSSYSPTRTMAVGLSGDFLVTGLSLWRPFIRHFFENGETGGQKIDLGPVKQVTDLATYENAWNYVVAHKENPGRKDEVANRVGTLQGLFNTLVPATIIARRYDTEFLGEPILQVSLDLVDQRCDSDGGLARAAISTLCADVRSWADMEYDHQNSEWVRGRRVDQPDRAQEQQRALERVAEGSAVANRPSSFTTLQRAATYPTLARLSVDAVVDDSAFGADSVREIATQITNLLYGSAGGRPADRSQVLTQLETSPFAAHVDELRSDSPKFAALCAYIDEIRDLKSKFPDPPKGPPDGSAVHHLIAFHNTPLSAFITFMLLYDMYEDVDIVYVHTGIGGKARGEMASYMQEKCAPGARNKILISTYRLMGTCFNLFRASYCILLEQPRNEAIQAQAVRRVARGGQVQDTTLVQFFDGHSLPETVLRLRSRNRSEITDMSYAGAMIDWNNFIDSEDQDEENNGDKGAEGNEEENEEDEYPDVGKSTDPSYDDKSSEFVDFDRSSDY